MEIRPAMKVLYGKPVHEYYIVEISENYDSVLLARTASKTYNDGTSYHVDADGTKIPFHHIWAKLDEIYIAYESIRG